MYGNICKTIKAWAVFLLVLSLIATLIASILFMETHENIANYGARIFFFGIIISFTSYYLLYGFGQLVENSDIIACSLWCIKYLDICLLYFF